MRSDSEKGWQSRFRPLRVVGGGPGQSSTTWRTENPAVPLLKRVVDPGRGEREVAALTALASLPEVVAPRVSLVETLEDGSVLIGMDDIRAGRDSRLRRISAGEVGAAASILAGVHALPVSLSDDRANPSRRIARASEDARLPAGLRRGLATLPVIGDAFCHGDLHPSNWVTVRGRPVGLLDWASAGRMDPEWDLAGLVLAAAGTASVERVSAEWNRVSGRCVDEARLSLYLWLLLEEQRHRTPGKEWLDSLAARVASDCGGRGPPHGRIRVERAVPEAIASTPWVGISTGAECVLEVLRRPEVLGVSSRLESVERYAGHACNDVLRLRVDGRARVVKIYNKPIERWLFPLERRLAEALGSHPDVRVLAPLSLAGGGDLFRVGGRPSALYRDAGSVRVGNSREDATRQARALAALHGVSGLPSDVPDLQRHVFSLEWPLIARSADGLLPDELLSKVRAVWEPLEPAVGRVDDPALPAGLQHGSLHRDHTAVSPDGALVVFDFEKASIGPAIMDVVRTAVFVGYRGNDETFDPVRIVGFLRDYHRLRPLESAERTLIYPILMRCLFHDLRAMAQDEYGVEELSRHAEVILEVARNRSNIEQALIRYID